MKLSDEIRNIESSKQFKKTILDFIRPKENSIYAMHDISGLKLLTRLKLNFSHLNEHKFRHNFKDTINPMCSCGFEPETADYYLIFSEDQLLNVLLFGSENVTLDANANILRRTIEFLKATERFNSLLF